MREILGQAKTIRELLKGVKYSIDYYQREYKWQDKQVRELIADLSGKSLDDYESGHSREKVAEYGHYFLGSIIISRKDNASFIVDGQQRRGPTALPGSGGPSSATRITAPQRNRPGGSEPL